MTDDPVKAWLTCIWEKLPVADHGTRSLLALDRFPGHLMENVREQLCTSEIDLAVIPGEMTGMLQPVNVAINRPFKCEVHLAYTEWIMLFPSKFQGGKPAAISHICLVFTLRIVQLIGVVVHIMPRT